MSLTWTQDAHFHTCGNGHDRAHWQTGGAEISTSHPQAAQEQAPQYGRVEATSLAYPVRKGLQGSVPPEQLSQASGRRCGPRNGD